MNNRIFGVKGDNIYCTALGQYDNWTTFEGLATDAWSVDTGTGGNFTGIVQYKGTVLAFKNDRVWKLFGSVPQDFQFIEFSMLGCIDHRSICEVNNILYYLSPQGICAYGGGVPELISEDLNENYVSGVAGGDGRRYYISLYDGSAYKLYTFDTSNGIWLKEDNSNIKGFTLFKGSLYAAMDKIFKFNAGTEIVKWSFTTKEFTEEYEGKKGYSELRFRVDLSAGARLNVYIKLDNRSYELAKSYSVSDFTSFTVPLRMRNCDHFQIKVEGIGDCTIHSMVRNFVIGGK